jgi:hypothetical protein
MILNPKIENALALDPSEPYVETGLHHLTTIVCVATIAGLVLTPKLWVSSRSYPLTPVATFLPQIPFPFDYIIFFGFLLLVALTAVAKNRRRLLGAVIATAAVLCALDQSRLQPWFYQYVAMLCALAPWYWRGHSTQARVPLNCCRIIVASVYLWSGLHKLNRTFIEHGFNYFVEGVHAIPSALVQYLAPMAFVVPLVEAGIGVGLLIRKTRRLAIVFAVLMHTFVLTSLGPLGHDTDGPVWPWNVAMIGFILILFRDQMNLPAWDIVRPRQGFLHLSMIILFFVMPVFSFIDLWDSFLSFALFSGDVEIAQIHISKSLVEKLPPELYVYVKQESDGRYVLDYDLWAGTETNTPVYPQARVFENIARFTCQYATVASDVDLTEGERSFASVEKSVLQLRLVSNFRSTHHLDCNSLRQ